MKFHLEFLEVDSDAAVQLNIRRILYFITSSNYLSQPKQTVYHSY